MKMVGGFENYFTLKLPTALSVLNAFSYVNETCCELYNNFSTDYRLNSFTMSRIIPVTIRSPVEAATPIQTAVQITSVMTATYFESWATVGDTLDS